MHPDQLRQWREQAGYSQAAAAARFFKVTRATLQNWEAGVTPIPAAVETACGVWGRRVLQERAEYGPVVLLYSDGPPFRGSNEAINRTPQEQYDMNAQAIARVSQLWGREDFHSPFIIDRAYKALWTTDELERVVNGTDAGAPTRSHLCCQYADALRALAADARQGTEFTVRSGPQSATAEKRAEIQGRAIAIELDELAEAARSGDPIYQQAEELLGALRRIGKTPAHALVNELARVFTVLSALRHIEAPRGSIHPSEWADFEHEMRRRGRSSGEFILSTADPLMEPGRIQATRDLVVVRRRGSSAVRGYSFMTWLTDFLRDLDAGMFDGAS
jgi:hypothetical protein